MQTKVFGTLPEGEVIKEYTIENERCSLSVMNFGAIVTNFTVDGRKIVGGFNDLDAYLKDNSHQGGLIGRVANRVANAEFIMDGVKYRLPKNNGENCLHGGKGFDRRVWEITEVSDARIAAEYYSADGEEGFPGGLSVRVVFTLLPLGFAIEYTAKPEGKTPIALTNHCYFNLEGFGGTIDAHKVKIYADTYTEVDKSLIPNGNRPSVEGTVFDLRSFTEISSCYRDGFIGFDHNFNLSPLTSAEILGNDCALAAEVVGGGYNMSVYTDQPALQFYIGNFLGKGPDFFGSVKQVKHGAMCLEAQTEPNCINRGEAFYDKGDIYRQFTAYILSDNK